MKKLKSKVVDRDLGYMDLMKALDELDGTVVVEVGVPRNAKNYEDGANQVLIASVNEFGSEKAGVPERSFLRSTMDEQRDNFTKQITKLLGQVVDGRTTVRQALDRLGLTAVARVQRKIVQLDDPPNAEATIKKKKSSNPLVDTGQLRQSIVHRVRIDGEE